MAHGLLAALAEEAAVECGDSPSPDPHLLVCDPPAVYRPTHPERTIFYQVFETHFDSYIRAYEERFEARSGSLRRVVPESVEQFLACGRLQGGFARIRCPACKREHLLAFSCRQRGVCSSCQAKRAALFAEHLTSEILPPVPYRHWSFTIPRAIRGLFERERSLLGLLSRTAYDSILKSFQTLFGREDVRPGCVLSIQTFGSFGANFHPHLHAFVSNGVFSRAGEFLELPSLDTAAVCEVFRRLLLGRLHVRERLSERFMDNLLGWVHPGFSVFAGEIIPTEDRQRLERVARYIARPTLAIDTLRRRQDGRFEIQTPPDPRTGASFRIFDPLEWIHAVTAHIPDRGQHQVRYYGACSNRARSTFLGGEAKSHHDSQAEQPSDEDSDCTKARRASWARLLRKIFEVDPLLCACGAEIRIVSIITDPRVVDRILRHVETPACTAVDPFQPRSPPGATALPT